MRSTSLSALCLCLLCGCATQSQERSSLPVVHAVAETAAVASGDDAADDPAIWVNPDAPQDSLVLATDKKRGLMVYDLQGNLLHRADDGRMNNVDLRAGFPLAEGKAILVAASNRSTDSLDLYALDPEQARLRRLASIPTGFAEPYGLCLYHSATGSFYAFVTDKGGLMRQWSLSPGSRQPIEAQQVREFDVGSQAEGCVADDELGVLYVGEEAVGVWRYAAEPYQPEARTLVAATGQGELVADVEGMGLYKSGDSEGYLVVSSQGDNSYAVYARGPGNPYLGKFQIGDGEVLDGVQETDGLDVVSAPLGPQYPQGLLVVQDGMNTRPDSNQNFKYVSWKDVAEALSLP